MKKQAVLLTFFLFLPFFVDIAFGQEVGVGVGLGIVNIGEPLAPGGIYHLPDLPVVNTGEVAGTYQVQASVINPKGWSPEPLGLGNAFRFSPQKFPLKPNQSQLVKVTLTLPLNTLDGDYLAYLEASRVQNPEKGIGIGPAAATKLYFTIKSGTILGAVRNRLITFILTRPEIYLLLAAFLLLEALFILRRRFRLQFKVEPKPYPPQNSPQKL